MPKSTKTYPSKLKKNDKNREVKSLFGRTVIRDARFQRGGSLPSFSNPYQINDNQALIPELWAAESVRTLYEEMMYGGMVHRDFSMEIAKFGETVHTRSLSELDGYRKQNDFDNIVDQDVTATDIPVVLNQRIYTSFLVGDGERSKSFKDLAAEYLPAAMNGPARMLDRIIAGQVYQFMDNGSGGLGTMSGTVGSNYMLDLRGVLNDNKAPGAGRWLGLASPSETELQKTDLFKSAERRGDGGRALQDALLGRIHGFNTFLGLNTPSIRNAGTGTATAVNNATGYPKGHSGVIAVDSGAALATGQWVTIAGDEQPLRVVTISTNDITFDKPLLNAVADNAVVTPVSTGLINQSSAIAKSQTHGAVTDGYPANWSNWIVVDGTGTPQVGQLVAFKESGGTVLSAKYSIVHYDSTNSRILLDRPLEADIDDNGIVCYGPDGDYNFGFQREAIALVNRPMELPMGGVGVRSAVAAFKNFAMHVKISYDDVKECHRINVGGLIGVKVLNSALGGVMYG